MIDLPVGTKIIIFCLIVSLVIVGSMTFYGIIMDGEHATSDIDDSTSVVPNSIIAGLIICGFMLLGFEVIKRKDKK